MSGETTTQTPPDAAADAAESAEMMRIAREADAATEGQQPATATTTTKPEGDGKPAAEGTDGKPAADGSKDGKPPAAGADPKKAADGTKPDANGGKPKTQAEKDADEAARKDRSWKKLEEERGQFRAERARIDAELNQLRATVSALKKKGATPAGPAKDSNGLTADDYTQLAKKYKSEGNDQMAQAAEERAAELKAKAPAAADGAAAATGNAWEEPEFQAEWNGHVKALIDSNPELANPDNPLVKVTQELVNGKDYGRYFRAFPDGIRVAHEVALLMRDAHSAKETREKLTAAEGEVATAKKEIERLNGLLQPRGSHPSKPPAGEKKLADMSDEEADREVRRIAEEADRGTS